MLNENGFQTAPLNDSISIEDHEFDIVRGSLSFTCFDKSSGEYKWCDLEDSKFGLKKYWNEMENFIPFPISSSSQIVGYIATNNDPIYALNINGELHLISKKTLREQAPISLVNYFKSNISE